MQIDYTQARSAPVIAIYVKYRDKFLLAKRSERHLTYQGQWSCLAGFVDDDKSLEEKIVFEIEEEIGLDRKDIKKITPSETYLYKDKDLGREWTRHLFLVEVTNANIKLNWEHSEYVWILPEDAKKYATTPGFQKDFENILKLA